jgi:hypothetical protein
MILLLLVLAVMIVALSGGAEARSILLSDDFTAPDWNPPDSAKWTVFTENEGDDVWIETNNLVTNVSLGGTSVLITKSKLTTNELTVLVDFHVESFEAYPVWVEIRSLTGTSYVEWFTVYYDFDKGWSYRFRKDDTVRTSVTFSRSILSGRWYSLNLTFMEDTVSVKVVERSSGTTKWSKTGIGTDAIGKDNLVSFGVMAEGMESPRTRYDEFELWDLRVPPNVPPIWALLPEMEAVEDEAFVFDFTDFVFDPDTPRDNLRITSESIYIDDISGLTVTFLFPNGVTEASVLLRLSDGTDIVVASVTFTIEPVNDPPGHSIPRGQTAVEDVPLIIEVSQYLWDVDNELNELTLETDSIYATIEGLNLTVVYPEGVLEHNLTLNISDGIDTTEAILSFVVMPTDDPPTLQGLTEFTAYEDSDSLLDLAPYLSDVDTEAARLVISVSDARATVDGQNVTFHFIHGGIDVDVTIEVSDATSTVGVVLQVHVMEVNDAPTVSPTRTYLFTEDEEMTVDLHSYISDEDSPIENLTLECDHDAVVSINGLAIVLLFTEWQDEQDIHFLVFDGISKSNGSFEAHVREVNDPPVILGLGELPPPFEIVMDEDSDLWIEVIVEDEEHTTFRYTLDSAWSGATIFQNGTIGIFAGARMIGTYRATVYVDDYVGGIANLSFEIHVVNVNDPPGIPSILKPYPHTEFEEGMPVTFRVTVYDPDMNHGGVPQVTWTSNISGELKSLPANVDLTFTSDKLPVGHHLITVNVDDGEYSTNAVVEIYIVEAYETPPPEEEPSFVSTTEGKSLIGIVIAIILVTVLIAYFIGRRTGPREPIIEGTDETDITKALSKEELALLGEEIDKMATELETHRETEGIPAPEVAQVVAPAQLEPVAVPTEEELEDRAHSKEVREVMKSLTQLPRGMPTALWGKDMSKLASEIVDGPKRTALDGTELVEVDGKWYTSDHTKVGTFLQEWKDEERTAAPGTVTEEVRQAKLDKLEDALLEGKISEETYQKLLKKYGE